METDGLLDTVTVIHSLVLKDIDTGEVVSCTDASPDFRSVREGVTLLAGAEVLYAHNGIGFDGKVLEKLYPDIPIRGTMKDTFVLAAARFAHIKDLDFKSPAFPRTLIGRHSLKAWGVRLGNKKIDYTDWCKENGIEDPWAKWTPEMQTYCEQDVETTTALVAYLRKSGIPAEMAETELELRRFLLAMEENGWPFDMEKAAVLQGVLAAKRQELEVRLRETFAPWEVSLGFFTPKRDNARLGYKAGVAVERKKTVEFNPGSRQHIANRLISLYGWEPEVFTENGQPKVDETTLKGLPYPEVPLLVEYLTVVKRLGQLVEGKEAWVKALEPNPVTKFPTVHGRVNQNGTITHRASHSNPNIAQVPAGKSPYGGECRELFRVPEGWVQIGTDASGLEARCLGHFVAKYDGGEYARLLLEGDVHTANRIALGLPDEKAMRDRAKTWYYAWMFGAGDEKLGKILDPTAKASRWSKIGKEKKQLFLKATPALKYLIDAVQAKVKKPGYILGLDGRPVYLRSEHSALNTLIQSAGAIICKRWVYLISKEMAARFGPPSWKGLWTPLGWIHDELQLAVKPEIADEVAALCIRNIESLTDHFKFRCPLTGEAKLGANWKETH